MTVFYHVIDAVLEVLILFGDFCDGFAYRRVPNCLQDFSDANRAAVIPYFDSDFVDDDWAA